MVKREGVLAKRTGADFIREREGEKGEGTKKGRRSPDAMFKILAQFGWPRR